MDVDLASHVVPPGSSAQRERLRKLRSWWRHERQARPLRSPALSITRLHEESRLPRPTQRPLPRHLLSNTWFQHLLSILSHQLLWSRRCPHLWMSTSHQHRQWLLLLPVNSYLLSTPWQLTLLTTTSTLPIWWTRNFPFLLWSPFSQVVGSLPPLEECHVPVYEQIHQEQVVAVMATQHRVENQAVQEQVQIVEQIQEQIVEPIDVLAPAAPSQQLPSIIKTVTTGVNLDSTGLVNPQFSITGVGVSGHRPLVHSLLWQSLMRPCTTKFIRNRSLQVRRPRT